MNKNVLEVFEDIASKWRWRLKAANGEIIAVGESYRSKRDADRAARVMVGVVLAMLAEDTESFPVHG